MLPQYNEELIRTLQSDKDNDSCYLIRLIQIKLKSMRERFINDEIAGSTSGFRKWDYIFILIVSIDKVEFEIFFIVTGELDGDGVVGH